MKEVAVCLVTNDNRVQTQYAIENLVSKTNVPLRLYIFDIGSTDEQLIEYLKKESKDKKWYFKASDGVSLSEAYNTLLDIVYQEYCVIFPVDRLVHKSWCEDLLHSIETIIDSGCVAIRTGDEKLNYIPLLHRTLTEPEDVFQHVLIAQDNIVKGIFMFKTDTARQMIGKVDALSNFAGFEMMEYVFRFSAHGMKNYYLRQQTCIKTSIHSEILNPKINQQSFENFKQAVDTMIKVNQFKK